MKLLKLVCNDCGRWIKSKKIDKLYRGYKWKKKLEKVRCDLIIIKVCWDVIVVLKKNKNVTVCLEKREILIIFVSRLGDVFPNRCTVSFFAYETVHQRGLNCLSVSIFGAPAKQIGAPIRIR